MRTKLLFSLLFILVGGMYPTNILSHNRWTDKDFVTAGLPFLTSKSPSGLLSMDTVNISNVYVQFNRNNGGLVNYHQSDDAFSIGVNANSIYRFSRKIVMQGAIDYTNFQGRHMTGSTLLDPYYNAIDITEFDDRFQGDKKLEQYHVLTEIGYNICPKLTLGASFDFTSANYSKMKDLRHSNTYSDIYVDLSAAYSFSDKITVGLSYNFRKSVEGIYYRRYSVNEKHYDVLLSYGTFWGKRKSYDETNGQISNMKKPLYNAFQGGSLQINFAPSEHFTLFAEGYYASRKGSFGIKSPNTIQYSSCTGADYGASLTGVLKTANARHILDLSMDARSITTFESVYKIGATTAGSSTITYFDPSEMSNTRYNDYRIAYRGDWNVTEFLPVWTLDAAFTVHSRHRDADIYPYYRNEKMAPLYCSLGGNRNFFIGKNNVLGLNLELGYISQLEYSLDDGSYIPGATQIKPRTSEMMLGREKEFLCNAQMLVSPALKYSRRFKKLSAYADFSYSWRRSLDEIVWLTGKTANMFSLSLGLVL